MKYLIYILATIICLGINSGLFGLFPILHTTPQLVLLLLIIVAFEKPAPYFLVIVFFGGLMLDLTTNVAIGSFIIGFLICAYLGRNLYKSVIPDGSLAKHLPWVVSLSIFVLYLWIWLYNMIVGTVITSAPDLIFKKIIVVFFGTTIYSLLLIYPMYFLVEQLDKLISALEARKLY